MFTEHSLDLSMESHSGEQKQLSCHFHLKPRYWTFHIPGQQKTGYTGTENKNLNMLSQMKPSYKKV
jgi:hypothetical protein